VTSCSATPAPVIIPNDERLPALARLFEDCFLDIDRDEGSPPYLLGVVFDADDATASATTEDGRSVTLMMRALDCHPSEALIGWNAPDDWWCLGIASGGWASNYDPDRPGSPRVTATARRRVRLLHLVGRDGEAINVVHQKGQPPMRNHWTNANADYAGMLDDCLRCALGIPTAPAPDTTIECWALLWIDHLLEAGTAGHLEGATWDDIAAMHPTFTFFSADDDVELLVWSVDHLVRAGELLARAFPWERIHRECVAGNSLVRGFPRRLLEWSDLGMFARTTMATLPPLDDAVLDLADLLDAEPYERFVETLRDWGLRPI